MAKSETKDKCFIIMPITTPTHLVEIYGGDKDHFKHVLECLFEPAIVKAGFDPISPISKGSNVIHSDIVRGKMGVASWKNGGRILNIKYSLIFKQIHLPPCYRETSAKNGGRILNIKYSLIFKQIHLPPCYRDYFIF